MSSPIVVANLLQEGQPCHLRLEDVAIQSTWRIDGCYPAMSIYKLRNGPTETDSISAAYKTHCRATAKAHLPLTVLIHLLVGETIAKNTTLNRQAIDGFTHQNDVRPSAIIGDTVAIVDEVSDGESIESYSRNLFLPVDFNFPVRSEGKILHVCSTQYWQVCSPALKLKAALLLQQQNTPIFESVHLVTGVCLYSDKILKASLSDSDGRVNVATLSCAPATLNELESIARCSSSLADVAMMLIWRMRNENYIQTVSITVDIPSWQYYWSVLALCEQGNCTTSEALQWMEAIDVRHDQISHVFLSAARHELQKRGARAEDADFQVSPNEVTLRKSMKLSLQNGKIPAVEDLLRDFGSQIGSAWGDFYSLIPDKNRPKDLLSLGHLSYVFEVVTPALQKKSTAMSPSLPRLILSINDRMEHRIYFTARNFLKNLLHSPSRKDLPRSILLEIYTARKLFVDGNKSRPRFFHHDPSPEINLSNVSSPDSPESEEESRRRRQRCLVDPLYVIGRLYGSERARCLKTWLEEAGDGRFTNSSTFSSSLN